MKQYLAGMKQGIEEGYDIVEQQIALKYDLLETVNHPAISDGLKLAVKRSIKKYDKMQNEATSWQEYAMVTKKAVKALKEHMMTVNDLLAYVQ